MEMIQAGSAGMRDVADPRSKESGSNYWRLDKAGRKQLRDDWNDARFDWTAPFHTIVTTPRGMGRQSVIDVHIRRGWMLQNVMEVELGNHKMTFAPARRAVASAPLPPAPAREMPAWDAIPPRPDTE